MATAGVQASVVTAHRSGEVVRGATGSGPTSVYLSRGVWRINIATKEKTLGLRVRRVTRCEASVGRMAEEARHSVGEAARAVGRKADQVLDGVKHTVVDFQERADVQGKAQRAAETANLKLDDLKTEITQRLGIDEPLSQYMGRKGKEIRWEVVGTAESVYNGVVAISNKPIVKRSIFGFLLFYFFSILWAARILLFDKKSEEAREQFGRELRLQKLREAGAAEPAPPSVRAPVEVKVNGRKAPSANDEKFRVKVRKIQEMARAVRASENEVSIPSESGFVSISGNGTAAEPENQQLSVPTNGKDLLKRRKPRKNAPADIQALETSAPAEKLIDGVVGEKLEPPVEPLVAQAKTPAAKDTKTVGVSEILRSKLVNEDSKSARSTDAQIPLQGDVAPSLNGSRKPHRSTLNGSATASSDGKPSLGEVKLPSNGDSTSNISGTAQPVPPVRSDPTKAKAMRVITSPEEARARIAARKARDGNSSARGSSANSARPKFPRITMPPVETAADESETDLGKDMDSVGAADVNSKSAQKETKSEEQQEEEAWLRDEVLRTIVLKVRDNEEAGRDSFHGLDSEEEQKFFKGLERKFEREGEAVKTWIQDRVENLDYGLGGVGIDDPPETVFPRWKDPENPHAKRFEKFQKDRQRILEQHMSISTPSQTDASTSSSPKPSPKASSPSSSPAPKPSPKASSPSSSPAPKPSPKASSPSSSPAPKPSPKASSPSSSPAPKPSPKASSPSSSPAPKPSPKASSPSSSPAPKPSPSAAPPSESRERLQSNGNASGSKTVVTSSGKQAKSAPREWQHTKKWAQELQQKYDRETDPNQRAMIEEIGQDLDRWITEEEIEEAQRLLSQGLAGEQEYVKRHYEKTREKIKQQHDMFGSQGMLNKYGEYKEQKEEPELWWLDLPFVCCIGLSTTSEEDGETNEGLYSLDMTPDFGTEGATYNHTVAFQDPKDASNFCGLMLSEQYHADVIPIAPKELYEDAKEEGFKVTVIKKGELGLVPGQALADVERRLIEIGSSVYWKELERMQSIDVDAILDEGLGYGRPSH